MSYNRLRYDQCAYKTEINQSVGPLEYFLNPMKYENCQKCRHEFGLVGGSDVSQIKGNLVDLENDLRGQTRQNTKCPGLKFHPTEGNTIQVVEMHAIHQDKLTLHQFTYHLAKCLDFHQLYFQALLNMIAALHHKYKSKNPVVINKFIK